MGDVAGEPLSPEEVDALYALPMEEFIPARAALAARLKEAGSRDAARAAGALRKPTVAAWTVNQLARRNAGELDALFRANARLRAAQTGAGRGGGPGFRDALRARQDALARLAEAAARILAEAGHPESRATLDRISATLMAAATDEETAALVRRGVLARDVEPAADFDALGLGGAAGGSDRGAPRGAGAPSGARERRAGKGSRRTGGSAGRAAERAALRNAEERVEALLRRAEDAERAADEHEREAAAAARSANKARTEAERARRAAAKARSQADEALEGFRSLGDGG